MIVFRRRNFSVNTALLSAYGRSVTAPRLSRQFASSVVMPKRLIVACDGTWMDSDEGTEFSMSLFGEKTLQRPSNITRLCRAVKTKDKNGIYQIVNYVPGVGSEDSVSSHLTGGALGAGIDKNIRVAYRFIRQNYEEGDEIYIIGFSRGAFTAQCIAHLINDIGLLKAEAMSDLIAIYQAWIEPWKGKGSPDANAKDWLAKGLEYFNIATGKSSRPRSEVTNYPVKIKALACYDTVSSLHGTLEETYKFIDTTIRPAVENSVHAISADEERLLFPAEVWAKKQGDGGNLTQCWFPGVHSNVGGCYADTNSSDITLAWMLEQLKKVGLEYDEEYVLEEHAKNVKYYGEREDGHKPEPFRPWGLGKINDSAHTSWKTKQMGKVSFLENKLTKKRNPGIPQKFQDTMGPLETNEMVHASARVRMECGGLGPDDNGAYVPDAMTDGGKPTIEKNGSSRPSWKFEAKDSKGKLVPVTLQEASLEPLEIEMIKRSLETLKNTPDSKDKASRISMLQSLVDQV